ncbi:hypothetical protein HD597_008829 [Nonomuraea thailandensis]|uniref:Secreted protein n=1 Tax=Nonomuraea thailandensis TaxID=1188745 RepID=A0A9X2K6U5_9ACTN|nr:hypothetical protein [Nonomuraea thailandensis]MCP2361809.1 hypothetical protein [Nonomuraea thailandensis]
MQTSPRRIAVAGVIAAAAGLVLPATAAHAVVDPAKVAVLESVQKMDPVLMANCATGTAADPAGAVVVPPEVPLVGCLAL